MDSFKSYLKAIITAFLVYLLLIYPPIENFFLISYREIIGITLLSQLATTFTLFFITFIPVNLITPNKKHTTHVAIGFSLWTTIGSLAFPISAIVAFGGAFSAILISNKALGRKNEKHGKEKLNLENIKVIKERVEIVSVEQKDESTTSLGSTTTNQSVTIGNASGTIPKTSFHTIHHERKVQDVWYKDENGKEGKHRFVNQDINIREGHEVDFIYTNTGYLEYIDNHSTGKMTFLYNYTINSKDLKTTSALSDDFLLPLIYSIPFLGPLLALFRINTDYDHLNKPVRRSYLGKATLWCSIFTFFASLSLTLIVYYSMNNGYFSFGLLMKLYIIDSILMALAIFFTTHLTYKRAKMVEDHILNLI